MHDGAVLGRFQGDFLRVFDGRTPPESPALRVHYDTWLHGLIGVLAERFAVVRTALGDAAFKAFARDYVHAQPLRRGDSNSYGDGFADFLAGHDAARDLAWLPDLARYAYALDAAHHADDARACGFDALMEAEARIRLHPSASVIHVGYDIRAAHAACLEAAGMPQIGAAAIDLLIGRGPDDVVIQMILAPLELQFLRLITDTASLFGALDRLNPSSDDMTLLQLFLARLVQHGLIVANPIEDLS